MKIEGVLKKRLSHTHEQHTMTPVKATVRKETHKFWIQVNLNESIIFMQNYLQRSYLCSRKTNGFSSLDAL